MPETPSGQQYEIRQGQQRVVVTEVGATLREYDLDGLAVIDGFALDRMADGARGQPLLPWPNRLDGGQYTFDGQTLQLPIDEIGRGNASHGLTRWLNWHAVDHGQSSVSLALTLHPRPGYPFTLALQITYTLTATGLTVTTRAENRGRAALPFGAGQHPYFTVGTPLIDDALLQIPAQSRLELDSERRLPTGKQVALTNTDYDFRSLRPIGPLVVDECFCGLTREADGRTTATLARADGHTLRVWMDHNYNYIQAFTGDTLAADRRRRGVAIEPMTCPPNAFRTSTDVSILEPGQTIELEWGIEPNLTNR